jgi:hypothetical protein
MLGGIAYKTGESFGYVCACCDIQRGGLSTDCENGTITLTNVTDVYTNYSGEVVEGISLHHIFGLLIAVLAGFGFIIVFMNLKSMDDSDKIRFERERDNE